MKKIKLVTAVLLGAVLLCGALGFTACDGGEELEAGAFYSLEEAYKSGELSKKDIKSIAFYHNGGREGNEKTISENFVPKPKDPAVLDDATQTAIKQTYWNNHYANENSHNITVDDIVFSYYGCYNGCVVVKISEDHAGVADVYWENIVGGVKIIYRNALGLSVWKMPAEKDKDAAKGPIYSLEEAYENGYLTKKDLEQIAYYHNNKVTYPQSLNADIELEIKKSAAENDNKKYHHNPEQTAQDYVLQNFYGEYNGAYAVLLENLNVRYGAQALDYWKDIGGVQIHYTSPLTIEVWKMN